MPGNGGISCKLVVDYCDAGISGAGFVGGTVLIAQDKHTGLSDKIKALPLAPAWASWKTEMIELVGNRK
jgi:hypothetical protein